MAMFNPKARCTIDQALKNAELQGIEVYKDEENPNAYTFLSPKKHPTLEEVVIVLMVEDGWVRSGSSFFVEKEFYEHIKSALTSITNCDWVDEHQFEWELYSLWTDDERLALAKQNAVALNEEREWEIAHDGSSEIEYMTLEEAIEDELDWWREKQIDCGVPNELPLATPITKTEETRV